MDNNNTTVQNKGFDPTGWELALVSIPSSSTSSATVETHMVCSFPLSFSLVSLLFFQSQSSLTTHHFPVLFPS
jgi:hypothetical protein